MHHRAPPRPQKCLERAHQRSCDHCDGDDKHEGDPAAAAVDGGHQRGRRWVAARYVTQQGGAHNKGGYT